MGAAQGLLAYLLWNPPEWVGLADWLLARTAALFAVLAACLVVYFTQGVDTLSARVRRGVVAGYAVVYAALGGYSAWFIGTQAVSGSLLWLGTVGPASVLLFVSINLICGFDGGRRRWSYALLFDHAWRNAVLLVTAVAITAAVWMVLFAGTGLLSLIGLPAAMKLLGEPLFIAVATGAIGSAAFGLGLERAAMTVAVRRFWLSINAWLLPLVLLFSAVWIVALPAAGLQALFETKNAAWVLLWFITLAVKFANCAYQDGDNASPYPRWLGYATQAAWLSLLPMVAVAGWALGLRVNQYGLSPLRLWALLVVSVGAVYVVGYSLSWRGGLQPARWMHRIGQTNIVAAWVLCLGLLAFLSPVANVQKIGVASHMKRVMAAPDGAVEPDWRYLRWDTGRYGREALQALVNDMQAPAAQRWKADASAELAKTTRYPSPDETRADPAHIEKSFQVSNGRTLPPGFISLIQTSKSEGRFNPCLVDLIGCVVWIGDLNADSVEEIILFTRGDWNGSLFVQTAGQWRYEGYVMAPNGMQRLDLPALSQAQVSESQWRDLVLPSGRLRVQPR
jgi:hypothetical protein